MWFSTAKPKYNISIILPRCPASNTIAVSSYPGVQPQIQYLYHLTLVSRLKYNISIILPRCPTSINISIILPRCPASNTISVSSYPGIPLQIQYQYHLIPVSRLNKYQYHLTPACLHWATCPLDDCFWHSCCKASVTSLCLLRAVGSYCSYQPAALWSHQVVAPEIQCKTLISYSTVSLCSPSFQPLVTCLFRQPTDDKTSGFESS